MDEKKGNEFIVRDRRISEASGDSSEPLTEQSGQEPSNVERARGTSAE